MFAGIPLIINPKATGIVKLSEKLIKYSEIKFHDFYKTFPGL